MRLFSLFLFSLLFFSSCTTYEIVSQDKNCLETKAYTFCGGENYNYRVEKINETHERGFIICKFGEYKDIIKTEECKRVSYLSH